MDRPSTEDEVERAAHDKVAVLVVPIAFVSEHSKTLVEAALGRGSGLCSFVGGRTCPRPHGDGPHARVGAQPVTPTELAEVA